MTDYTRGVIHAALLTMFVVLVSMVAISTDGGLVCYRPEAQQEERG